MFRTLRLLALVHAAFVVVACGSSGSPNPSPPGGAAGESITGRERLGWDQQATSAADLATLRYAIYVDGTRSELADVTCASTAGAAGFACSSRLPTMSAGTHTLEIASFRDVGGVVESAKSAALRVTVTGASAATVEPWPLEPGGTFSTVDGETLVAHRIAQDLREPTDLAIASDGRLFVTDATGRLRVSRGGEVSDLFHLPETAVHGGLLGLALSPDFDASGHLFAVAAFDAPSGPVFRVLRLRIDGGRALDPVIVLPDIAASRKPAAALRFGPDRKLYAAFDAADDDDRAVRMSEWSGKILRLEPDGRTPGDQPAASPVLWSGVRVPRGMDWSADGTLWAAEEGIDAIERVRAINSVADGGVRRARSRSSYLLPRPFNGRSLTAYVGQAVPGFADDLFLAGGDAGYLLRISLDREDRGRVISTERLLEGRIETVRAVAAGRDGALYFCTADAIWRLTASAPLQRQGSR